MHHTSITAMMTTTIITITIALVLLSSSSSIAITAADIKADRIANAKVFLESTRDIQMEDMRQYVAIPSVAAESKHDPDSRDAAEWLREWLIGRLGMKDAAIYESGYRNPVVIASTGDTSKPGIVIYGHYDIQPADGEWTISGPYELLTKTMEGYGEVMTGRGASDCKGQQYLALSALEALEKTIPGGLASLPINIIVCVEGEEEIGSPGFGHVLRSHADLFRNAAFVLSSDGSNENIDGAGELQLSTRGAMGCQIDVFGAFSDLHSGAHGGSFLNPIVALSRVVASLHDPATSRITLDGFYDNVSDLSAAEMAELEVLDDAEEARKLGIARMSGEIGYTTMERKTVRPTLEMVGIYSGFMGEGTKTVLPAEAHAKIVFRLVAGQDPDKVFKSLEEHLARLAPTLADGLRVEVQRFGPGAPGHIVDRTTAGFNLVREELTTLYGKAPVFKRTGGSVNAFADFKRDLDLESYSFGFGDLDGYIHAPDERFRTASLYLGQDAYLSMILSAAEHLGASTDEL